MCALLGMDFNMPVFAGFSFREFGRWSEENADGWGLAWYPDRSASLIKEPVKWRSSPHMQFLNTYQQNSSRIYIAHVRHRTIGGTPTHADTHPFLRECNGRDYTFAHNGTILQAETVLPVERFRPMGGTDSERLFCHLLGKLEATGQLPLETEDHWRKLHDTLRELNRFGKLNCLFSDGERLFCYRDINGWKSLMAHRLALHGDGSQPFEDPNVKIQVAGKALQFGTVIATHPLNEKGWSPLHPGELLVLQGGQPRFSCHPAMA